MAENTPLYLPDGTQIMESLPPPEPIATNLFGDRPYSSVWIATKRGIVEWSRLPNGKVEVHEYPHTPAPVVTDQNEPRLFRVWAVNGVPGILSEEWWPEGAESILGSFWATPVNAAEIFEKYKVAYAEPYDDVSDLLGKTLAGCYQEGDEAIHFILQDGRDLKLWHKQQCCESVTIEDVNGDLNDLVGAPLTLAEESISYDEPEDADVIHGTDSFTWTFYRFATAKGFVNIRWYGESNGYYSEAVDFSENIPGICD